MVGGHAWLSGGVRGWGACVVARGECMVGWHAWLLGGVHGCWGAAWLQGACVVARGHAWLPGGMHGWGHAWLPGACMVVGVACVGYNEIWSMSGWYASYWNAFLLVLFLL